MVEYSQAAEPKCGSITRTPTGGEEKTHQGRAGKGSSAFGQGWVGVIVKSGQPDYIQSSQTKHDDNHITNLPNNSFVLSK